MYDVAVRCLHNNMKYSWGIRWCIHYSLSSPKPAPSNMKLKRIIFIASSGLKKNLCNYVSAFASFPKVSGSSQSFLLSLLSTLLWSNCNEFNCFTWKNYSIRKAFQLSRRFEKVCLWYDLKFRSRTSPLCFQNGLTMGLLISIILKRRTKKDKNLACGKNHLFNDISTR